MSILIQLLVVVTIVVVVVVMVITISSMMNMSMFMIAIMIMTKSNHIPLAVKRLMLSILIQQLVVDSSLQFKTSLAGQTLISKYKTRRKYKSYKIYILKQEASLAHQRH